MCKDALVGDLVESRARWYDVPALLLLHRPMRCRICKRRHYLYSHIQVNSNAEQIASLPTVSMFPNPLAVAVAVALIIGGLVFLVSLIPIWS